MSNKIEDNILDIIISSEGNCLTSITCPICPFRLQCNPRFLSGTPWSRQERVQMALDQITDEELVSDH